jgi:uncharacterized DUF497 family protein
MEPDVLYQDEHFSWRTAKARSNASKHKITFEQAKAVFRDSFADHLVDEREDYGEERWNVTGQDSNGNVLVVTYTWRDARQHIISARRASPHEQREFLSNLF